jgi:hypothetical protein
MFRKYKYDSIHTKEPFQLKTSFIVGILLHDFSLTLQSFVRAIPIETKGTNTKAKQLPTKIIKMKKLTILIAALFMALMVNAQTELAGSYKIDRSKSQLSQEFSMAPNEVSIKVSGNEFLVEKKVSFQGNAFTISDKYTLDGKECLNPGWAETIKKSTAAWDKQAKKLTVPPKSPCKMAMK